MKTALILNFTGNTYHYGCYGTSNEIYNRLVEAGYITNYVSVRASHGLKFFPDNSEKFFSSDFANQFVIENVALTTAIDEADIVVVNAEGTLHRLSKGSMTLLYFIYLAKQLLRKPVFLINHSCYPSGDLSSSDFDSLYKTALTGLDGIVIREPLSSGIYQRSGLAFEQGFDSLPLYLGRYELLGLRKEGIDNKKILLCGGINYPDAFIQSLVDQLTALDGDYHFEFILGGKGHLAEEDNLIHQKFQQLGLDIKLVQADSFEQWAAAIANAAVLISGRFHYSIAGLAMGVPCITFPSNTPKVEGVYQLLNEEGYLRWDDGQFAEKFAHYLQLALSGQLGLDDERRIEMLRLGEKNYDFLRQ